MLCCRAALWQQHLLQWTLLHMPVTLVMKGCNIIDIKVSGYLRSSAGKRKRESMQQLCLWAEQLPRCCTLAHFRLQIASAALPTSNLWVPSFYSRRVIWCTFFVDPTGDDASLAVFVARNQVPPPHKRDAACPAGMGWKNKHIPRHNFERRARACARDNEFREFATKLFRTPKFFRAGVGHGGRPPAGRTYVPLPVCDTPISCCYLCHLCCEFVTK